MLVLATLFCQAMDPLPRASIYTEKRNTHTAMQPFSHQSNPSPLFTPTGQFLMLCQTNDMTRLLGNRKHKH